MLITSSARSPKKERNWTHSIQKWKGRKYRFAKSCLFANSLQLTVVWEFNQISVLYPQDRVSRRKVGGDIGTKTGTKIKAWERSLQSTSSYALSKGVNTPPGKMPQNIVCEQHRAVVRAPQEVWSQAPGWESLLCFWKPGSLLLPDEFLQKGNDNSSCLTGSLWELNKLIHIKPLKQYLPHSKQSINVTLHFLLVLWVIPTQPVVLDDSQVEATFLLIKELLQVWFISYSDSVPSDLGMGLDSLQPINISYPLAL